MTGAVGTSNSYLVAVSNFIDYGSCGMPGSSISTTCGSSSLSVSTTGRSTVPSISISGSSTYYSSDSASTPGIYTYPMRRPSLSVKVKCLFSSPPNTLTQAITVSGIEIRSQLRLTIFFAVFKAMNLNPPCIFLLGPRKIPPLVI